MQSTSVRWGKPKDGDPRACYVQLHIGSDASVNDADSVNVEFIRVPYNIEESAQAIEESVLPDAFADMLREAR